MANKALFSMTINQESMNKVVALAKQFPKELQGRVLEKATFNAALIVLRAAQNNVRKHKVTGALFASLARRKIKELKQTGAYIYSRKTSSHKGGFHAHLLEFGHRMVVRKKRGMFSALHQVGHVPAFPFMRPALDDNAGKVVDHIAKVSAKALKRHRLGRPIR